MMEACWKEKRLFPGSQTAMDLSGLSGNDFPTDEYQDNHTSCAVWQRGVGVGEKHTERNTQTEKQRDRQTKRPDDISPNDPILKGKASCSERLNDDFFIAQDF
jgi:hypothetical protein|uniref:Uncharacterized protein n=1 Tax=Mus musculus TaxID=10090 RepID=Q3TYP2_MOUSE|nr:unnamed protein product [Mus musculus]